MAVKIEVTGIKQVNAFLNSTEKRISKNVNDSIKKAGFFIEGEVKQSIAGQRAETKSVDTGRFLNSVKTLFPKEYVAVIESAVSYAKFLEYGTSRMSARRHFGNTKTRNTKKIRDFIAKSIS